MLNRRKTLLSCMSGAGLIALNSKIFAYDLNGKILYDLPLYRNSQKALMGSVANSTWQFPGVQASPSLTLLRADILGNSNLLFARWVIVWDPEAGSAAKGVRLITADSGPSNIQEITGARVERSNTTSPVHDSVHITTSLQNIISSGIQKFIGHQTYGDNSAGCKIYGSWIELVWG